MSPLLPLTLAVPLAFLCWLFPLTVYFISLSLFGLPHIYYELYYIKHRYHGQFPITLVLSIFLLLSAIVLIKIINLITPLYYATFLELSLVSGLLVICCVYRQSPSAVLLLGFFVLGIIYFPVALFLMLAFLHNLTPLGFFKQEGYTQRLWSNFFLIPVTLFGCVMLLNPPGFLWPFLIQHGYPFAPTSELLRHYLPVSIHDIILQSNFTGSIVRAFFSMAVFYQLMHYDSTIRVLPSLLKLKQRKISFYSYCLFSGFTIASLNLLINFIPNKQIYSIAASFHAWLEIPLLFLLFSSNFNKQSQQPENFN